MIGNQTVSAFVITQNEEANVGDCLESIKWADELTVVDSFSEDATVEIARRYTDKVISHEFAGFVAQTQFAFQQATGDWAVWLDADERLTAEAAAEVVRGIEAAQDGSCAAFSFPRKTFFLGKWITHGGWRPDRKVRVVRRTAACLGGEEPHPEFVVEGRVRELKGEILHLSYPGGVFDYMRRAAKYADASARARLARGRRASLLGLLMKPPLTFAKGYLLKLGVLDGLPGLTIAVGSAYYRFMRDMRMWELSREGQAE